MTTRRHRYQVVLERPARRFIERTRDRRLQARIYEALERLAENPLGHGAAALQGYPGTYRLRVGMFRIIYSIRNDELIVLVLRISKRSDAHR